MTRHLIVNADDFGQSPGINKGIILAHEQGIVTSASLMVRGAAAVEAAAYGRANTHFSLGLHVDLGEWVYQDGDWVARYEVVSTTDRSAVAGEVTRQLDNFRHLVGRDPTHLDTHQHVHRHKPVRSILLEVADKLKIPLRHFSSVVRYCGDFYGQTGKGEPFPEGISVSKLIDIVRTLPVGVTELACHPGCPDNLNSAYGYERSLEVRALCDPQVRSTITNEQIHFCSFGKISR
jgi:chitin disaccharide deacetylase